MTNDTEVVPGILVARIQFNRLVIFLECLIVTPCIAICITQVRMHRRDVALDGDRFFETVNRAIGIALLAHCKTEQMQGIRILGLAGENLAINSYRIACPAALVQRDGILHHPGNLVVLYCH